MRTQELSPRETEIVDLSAEGLTNDAIAYRLGLSVGTVNTYWLRIKVKTGGSGRTESVVSVFKKRAEQALSEANIDWTGIEAILAKRGILDVLAEKDRELELRTALAMLHIAIDKIQSTVWATDRDLKIHEIANGELPSARFGVKWELGKTIYEVFNTKDPAHLAVAAHLSSLDGSPSAQRLTGEFSDLLLRVVPLADEHGEVAGCISILSVVES